LTLREIASLARRTGRAVQMMVREPRVAAAHLPVARMSEAKSGIVRCLRHGAGSRQGINPGSHALDHKQQLTEAPMKVLMFVAALALLAAPAEAASKKKSRHHHQGHNAYGAQIACTPAGCLRVPRGCHPAPGRTFDGDPSGFDVMVCGRGSYSMYGVPY
jgi:hypothetical protein